MISSLKEFDKLEERIARLVQNMRALREENQKLKQQMTEIKQSTSQRDSEKTEIKKKITALLELVDSADDA